MEDRWLDRRLRFVDELHGNTNYAAVLKAGMDFRLRQLSRDEIRHQVEELLAGKHPEVRTWIFTVPKLERVEDRAVVVANRLRQEIERLPDLEHKPYFQSRAKSCCEEREELEGIAILLGWAKQADRLNDHLKKLDEVAEIVFARLPDVDGSEMIDRASNIAPDQWWAPME